MTWSDVVNQINIFSHWSITDKQILEYHVSLKLLRIPPGALVNLYIPTPPQIRPTEMATMTIQCCQIQEDYSLGCRDFKPPRLLPQF
jgi:hypothetical protein